MSQPPIYLDVPVTATHQNIQQEVIIVTINRLKLDLQEHSQCLSDAKEWHTPAGLFISFVVTFCTADFNKTFLGFSSSTWQAVHVIALGVVLIWLIKCLCKKPWKKKTIDHLIDKIKTP